MDLSPKESVGGRATIGYFPIKRGNEGGREKQH